MAYFIFTKSILESKPIEIFNYGKMKRDFTYIDDIIEGIVRIMNKIPEADPGWKNNNSHDISKSFAPYRLYNFGNNQPVELEMLVSTIEKKLNKIAIRNYKPMQPGDVETTYADINDLSSVTGFKPSVSIEEGIGSFIEWYMEYYKVAQKSTAAI
jgi:UDP-glucuronate 4-epimerase